MPSWQNKFDERMLEHAGRLIGLDEQAFKHIGGFENVIYSFKQDGNNRILRVAHDSHRSVGLMEAEMHFIDYLAKHGVQIAGAVAFANGNLIESISSGEDTFILTLFENAPGGHINAEHPDWGTKLFEQWGEITGKMHALEQDYTVPEGMTVRPHQDVIGFDTAKFSSEERMVYEKLQQLEKKINALPRERGAYGLCHRDLHHGNFHVHNGQMVAFDFDDCGYDYFVQDFAMAVYYGSVFGIWAKPVYENERVSVLANEILDSFFTGYSRYYRLDAKCVKELPLFIEKRRLEIFLLLYNIYLSSSDERKHEWIKHNLQDIEQGVPCMELKLPV
ncbi:hypothetical protein E0485_09120 [Paenibacillus albiflavus]|uniref:Aminoglycoside phosphotransferase domain-containing protein n=1 Tax=Paenibacillus albiflavus TaxID=2545760 RepID=A0A4R4EET8_9BACL|nr:phosphotransferase [Paenibacillus albiflavus]TCZ78269.1 hypothetical protein E0485_09120 [Paenibacillus albiflavus]